MMILGNQFPQDLPLTSPLLRSPEFDWRNLLARTLPELVSNQLLGAIVAPAKETATTTTTGARKLSLTDQVRGSQDNKSLVGKDKARARTRVGGTCVSQMGTSCYLEIALLAAWPFSSFVCSLANWLGTGSGRPLFAYAKRRVPSSTRQAETRRVDSNRIERSGLDWKSVVFEGRKDALLRGHFLCVGRAAEGARGSGSSRR